MVKVSQWLAQTLSYLHKKAEFAKIKGMIKFFYHLFRAARPRQWIKNLALFAAIIFTGQLFNASLFGLSFQAFLIFCLLSSTSYLINDILDAPADRLHPFKRLRPVAAGAVSFRLALIFAALGIGSGLFLATKISPAFLMVALIFVSLHLSYSLFLKKVAVIDILAIALSYILRVYAGEAATGFHLSIWLMLCVISLSLFLALGKRRSELTLLSGFNGSLSTKVRQSLSHYSERLLDVYTAMFANSTWVTYALFTFIERPPVEGWFWQKTWVKFLPEVPERKWLMLTIPFVIYGIMRYTQLIYEKKEGESPERVLLSDWPLLVTVGAWIFLVVAIIYGLG